MTDNIIRAEFVDFKNIKTRNTFQLIFEVPAEQTQDVLTKLGHPNNHESTWVGIARLACMSDKMEEKPKSFAGQAKMMSEENEFNEFINHMNKTEGIPARATNRSVHECEEKIEYWCGVASCSELIEGTEAGKKFKQLQAQYLSWRDAP